MGLSSSVTYSAKIVQVAINRRVNRTRQIKAGIYARVSTDDQSHSMQTHELMEYVVRMGWVPIDIYTDKISGAKARRPGLERLMADARLKKIDVVLVWKLDRFARSLSQLIANIQLLDSYGVRFVCVTQGIDTDQNNPISRLMLHIFGAFAEFERAIIAERVRSGMAQAKREGSHCGRPTAIWRRDEAFELRAQGLSLRQIAAKLGRPETSIRRALKSAPKG
jgi:DNA invertase Pin-like site-specific DNA recombinase